MDNNLHNDGLEDFLRKSFEQYDDSPSDGLWDKIETDLGAQPKVFPIGSSQRWLTIAAAAMLLILVVGQYIYFQKGKREMVEVIKLQNDKIDFLEKQLIERGNDFTENFNLKSNEPSINSDKKQLTSTAKIKDQKIIADLSENNISKKNNLKKIKDTQISLGQLPINELIENTTTTNTETNHLTDKIDHLKTLSNQQITIAPNSLDLIDLKNIKQPIPNLSLPTSTEISPISNSGNLSMGIHHSYLSTREKMARVIRRPTGGPDRIFNSTRAMTGTTTITGIAAIYQTKNNWLFESGINYRATTLSTNHLAHLRFMDRRQGGGDSQYDFEYALNTSAGVVDIEVRADQTNPDETIDEFEKIIVEIEANQVADYLSIPFLVGHQIGFGKFNANIKSGLLFNFLMHQSFDITGTIINNNFRNSRASFSRRNGLGLRNTTTDFMAAIGVNYELNRKWSAQISPTIIAPLGNRHNDPYIKTSGISAGIDFGLYFKF